MQIIKTKIKKKRKKKRLDNAQHDPSSTAEMDGCDRIKINNNDLAKLVQSSKQSLKASSPLNMRREKQVKNSSSFETLAPNHEFM